MKKNKLLPCLLVFIGAGKKEVMERELDLVLVTVVKMSFPVGTI